MVRAVFENEENIKITNIIPVIYYEYCRLNKKLWKQKYFFPFFTDSKCILVLCGFR